MVDKGDIKPNLAWHIAQLKPGQPDGRRDAVRPG